MVGAPDRPVFLDMDALYDHPTVKFDEGPVKKALAGDELFVAKDAPLSNSATGSG